MKNIIVLFGCMVGLTGCVLAPIGLLPGRPLRIQGESITTPVHFEGGSHWAQGPIPDCSHLDESTRLALEMLWLQDARGEHASIPAFSRISWQLAAIGAPSELLERAHLAALEEINHARLCFALAEGYGGCSYFVQPIPEMFQGGLDLTDDPITVMTTETIFDGCLVEGFFAKVAETATIQCEEPATLEALKQIAHEEKSHTDFSWAILEWLLEQHPEKVKNIIRNAFNDLETRHRPNAVTKEQQHLVEKADSELLIKHGRLLDEQWRRIWDDHLRQTRQSLQQLLNRQVEVDRVPNILLFNCHYGAGHKMATQAIVESLVEYHIHVVDIYNGPLRSLDPMREIFPPWSNEALYNDMAKKEQNGLLNFAAKVAPQFLMLQRDRIEKLLVDYIGQNTPDMIISCVPLMNSMLLSAAKQFDIPFLVVTTDIDISAFCYGFKDDESSHDWNNFRMTVPFCKETWEPQFGACLPSSVKDSLQYSFGYPTRYAFSESFDEFVFDQLRKEYEIQRDENVILVMMGGNAAQAAMTYAELFLGMKEDEIENALGCNNKKNKIRLICLCGDVTQEVNYTFMAKLNSFNESKNKRNERVIVHACPGTPKIAELVSLPELCAVISKPGGSTVNEMIKKRVPMIYHVSGIPLDWESGNMEYGVSQDFGRPFQIKGKIGNKEKIEFMQVLTSVFHLHEEIQEEKKTVPEASIDFSINLRSAVAEMLLDGR